MNTAKQMIWLPTTREEKYKAKQAIDTFFVRAATCWPPALVFVGTHVLDRGVAGFARAEHDLRRFSPSVVAWLLLREYRRLTAGGDRRGACLPENRAVW